MSTARPMEIAKRQARYVKQNGRAELTARVAATNQEDSAPPRARPTPDKCRPSMGARGQGSEAGVRRLAA
jgi:hypothetical protein